MSHETTLREVYDALNSKNIPAVKGLIAEDAVFHLLPNPIVPATTLNGRDSIMAFLEKHLPSVGPQQVIDAISTQGEFATAYVTSQTQAEDGSSMTVNWVDVFQFQGGRIKQHVSIAG